MIRPYVRCLFLRKTNRIMESIQCKVSRHLRGPSLYLYINVFAFQSPDTCAGSVMDMFSQQVLGKEVYIEYRFKFKFCFVYSILEVSFYSELIIIIIKFIKCHFYFGNVLSCSVVSFAFRTSTLVLEFHSLAL
jgi:hypothetical protein